MAAKSTELTPEESRELMLNPAYQTLKQFEIQQRMAQMYVQSTIVPETYKGNIGNCIIAIDMAQRMGANPLMVMQNLIIIYGRPSWSAKFLIATVNTCGRFNPISFRFTVLGELGEVEYTEYVYNAHTKQKEAVKKIFDGKGMMNIECVAYTTQKGKTEVLESSPVTIETAIKEGWYTKSGSKWQSMPKQMLMYRAASWWTSVYAPEISMGFPTKEEVENVYAEEVEDVINEPQPDAQKPVAPEDVIAASLKKQTAKPVQEPINTPSPEPKVQTGELFNDQNNQ